MFNVGVQFQNISEDSYVIDDNFFGTPLNPDDQIFIFDPAYYGYTIYQYGELNPGVFGFSVQYADGEPGEAVYSITVNKGDNILLMPADTTVTPAVSGQVEKSGTKKLTFTVTEDDYIFPITNPFPQATKMSDLTCLESDDQIFVWDSEYYGYTIYQYGEIEQGVYGFSVQYADGEPGDPITDTNFVVFGAGEGGLYMPTDSREWSVTFNY